MVSMHACIHSFNLTNFYTQIFQLFTRHSVHVKCECCHAIDMDIKMNGILTWDLPVSRLESFHSLAIGLSHLLSLSLAFTAIFSIFFFTLFEIQTENILRLCVCVCARTPPTNGFRLSFSQIFSSIDFKNILYTNILTYTHAYIDICFSYVHYLPIAVENGTKDDFYEIK